MKQTGIVRRMDELGRIVIPKEIRKRLSIDNGDLVDIFAFDKQIVLTKYHPLSELNSSLKGFVRALEEIYPFHYLVLDKEAIVCSNFEEIIGKKISKDFYKKVKDFLGVECPLSTLNLDLGTNAFDIFILPIEKFSDLFGYVIVIDKMITQRHKDFCSMLAKYSVEIL